MQPMQVIQVLYGTVVREGAGVKLQRYIGIGPTNSLDPFLLLDYFNSNELIDYMAGFPPHPHRGFETITYLLHGSITHEDNKGHKGTIGPGDVQWMTAGKGIIHSEMPAAEQGRLQGLQLWLNLPAGEKMCPPRYQEITNEQLPLEIQPSGARIKVVAGVTEQGTRSPIIDIATQPLFLDIYLPEKAALIEPIPSHHRVLLLVLVGEVLIENKAIKADELAVVQTGGRVCVRAIIDSHCLLIAAAPLNEPIVRHGPFVMNTQEEIAQAVADFRNGLF